MQTAVSENMDARTLAKLLIHRMRVILLMRYAPEIAALLGSELTEADNELAKELSKSPTVNSDTLRILLASDDIELITVSEQEQFWVALQEHQPALVILDVDMPGVKGLELCRGGRSDDRWQQVGVVINGDDLMHTVTAASSGAAQFYKLIAVYPSSN